MSIYLKICQFYSLAGRIVLIATEAFKRGFFFSIYHCNESGWKQMLNNDTFVRNTIQCRKEVFGFQNHIYIFRVNIELFQFAGFRHGQLVLSFVKKLFQEKKKLFL